MAILYTVGNINLDTVEVVAKSVKMIEPNLKIEKVIIFETKESDELHEGQMERYRKYFGNNIIREGIRVSDDGTIDSSVLFSEFNNDAIKIVDLSNGGKATTSILYMAACLCRIERIYYLLLKSKPSKTMILGQDYEYIKLKDIDCPDKLSKISYFDLIYYNDELSGLISEEDRETNRTLETIYNGLHTGIHNYFTGTDYRSVISDLTINSEKVISAFLKFLQTNKECLAYCRNHDINLFFNRDPVGIETFFAKNYLDNGTNDDIKKLLTLPGIFSALRHYRNIAAHNAVNTVELTEEAARIVINLSIESLKVIKQNQELWDTLKKGVC